MLIKNHSFASDFSTLKKSISNCNTYNELSNCLKNSFNGFRLRNPHVIINRSLDFDNKQIIIDLELISESRSFDIRLCLLVEKSDTIVFGEMELLFLRDNILYKTLFKYHSEKFYSYKTNHNSFYKTHLTVNRIKEQISKLEIYGFGCGYSNDSYPVKARQMMNYVDKEKVKKLSKMLRQESPEIQAYGLTGLLDLKEKGYVISEIDLKLIHHLKNRDSGIYSCSSCEYGGIRSISSIIEGYKP